METFEAGYHRQSKAKLVGIIVAIVVIAGIVLIVDHLKSSNKSALNMNTAMARTMSAGSSGSNASAGTAAGTNAAYKDGTYTATSNYFVPHGQEEIDVSLTIKSGSVSDVSIQNSQSDGDSAEFQQGFAAEYKSKVVGKPLSSLALSNIAGASDTTQGFNDALDQIRTKARA